MSSTPIDSATQGKFVRFPELPTEIRLKIWKYNLPAPRVVVFPCHAVLRGNMGDANGAQSQARRTNSVMPKKFACHEAKQVFDDYYSKLPLQTLDFGDGHRVEGFLYVDYRVDSVLVNTETLPETLYKPIRSNIRWSDPNAPIRARSVLKSIEQVRHLVIFQTRIGVEVFDEILRSCKQLQHVSYAKVDWAFGDIDSGDYRLIKVPCAEINECDSITKQAYGLDLAWQRAKKRSISAGYKTADTLENVSFNSAFIAKRLEDSKTWILWCHRPIR